MIGDKLKYLRTKHKDSQATLAATLGVSVNYLSQLENNRKQPSLKLLEKFANNYQCTVASIVETDALKSDLKQIIDKQGLQTVMEALNEILNEHKNK